VHSGECPVRLQRCPGCQGDTPAVDTIAGLCPTCFTDGKPVPLGSEEPLTTRNLVRVGRGMPDTVKPSETRCTDLHQEEGGETMAGELRACRHCGKAMPKGSLFAHERVRCEKRPKEVGDGGAGLREYVSRRRAAEKSGKVEVVARPSSVPEPRGEMTPKVSENGHCSVCLFRDLGRHIDQDLVRRAVVGGMALDAACAFVREAKVALAK
jgi:hypothetical protein